MSRRSVVRCLLTAAVALTAAVSSSAADRFALIVTGASAGPQYAIKYDGWRLSMTTALLTRFGFSKDHVLVLAEDRADDETVEVKKATRENVRAALNEVARRASDEDVVLVLLMGHGAADEADDAKFNLVGPDLTTAEWADAVKPIRGRIVFVNGASASFPFLRKLAGPRRIVITADATPTQQYETTFPEYFVGAFQDTAADTNKDGRVSIWEAFVYASAGVKKWFADRGQLPTERALLDDTGDGIGREAIDANSRDGDLAKITFLEGEPLNGASPAAAALAAKRAALQAQVEDLRTRRVAMTDAEYESRMEALLLEIAELDRQIRGGR